MEFLVAATVSKQAITEAVLLVHPIKVGKIWLMVLSTLPTSKWVALAAEGIPNSTMAAPKVLLERIGGYLTAVLGF